MNRCKRTISLLLASMMILSLAACGQKGAGSAHNNSVVGFLTEDFESGQKSSLSGFNYDPTVIYEYNVDAPSGVYNDIPMEEWNTANYDDEEENRFMSVKTSPLSTFGADVDTTSYANVRRMIKDGQFDIPKGAVRIEEFVNYFKYDYKYPTGNEPFNVGTEIFTCPWNAETLLMRIGVQTPKIDMEDAPPCNLVFLVDTSGSMNGPTRLGMVQKALSMLTNELDSKDRISIVTYAGSSEVLLRGVSGDKKDDITSALESLMAHGGTNGSDGIITAYKEAKDNYIENGINRVILCTDGDLNIGVTSQSELVELVKDKKKDGIFLSVLGVGDANYNDSDLEAIANKGDGNYNYLDSELEARKVLVDEMGGNLITVAKDAKFQIEFNPSYIKAYRQIGYENRAMAAEDFHDDTKDGGEIGAGQQVTILYEIVPVDSNFDVPDVDLKYTTKGEAVDSTDWLTVSVRYKEPTSNSSTLHEYTVDERNVVDKPSKDSLIATCAAEFAMLLRESQYLNGFTFDNLVNQTKTELSEYDLIDSEEELIYLIKQAKSRVG